MRPVNRDLLLPYALPYGLYVALAALPEGLLGRTPNLALRLLLVSAALVWGWGRYVSLRGPRSATGSVLLGALAGLLGTGLWVALVLPFGPPTQEAWSTHDWTLRTLGAVALVPLCEELLLRGYVLRLVVQWQELRASGAEEPWFTALDARNVSGVASGAWTPAAVAISTILFAAGHQPYEWVAAIAYGLLMSALWIVRRDLLSCVVAHAVTNLVLALLVLSRAQWAPW